MFKCSPVSRTNFYSTVFVVLEATYHSVCTVTMVESGNYHGEESVMSCSVSVLRVILV